MEENNTTTRNITGFAEIIFVAIGLILLLSIPLVYSLSPPSNSPLMLPPNASGASSLSINK